MATDSSEHEIPHVVNFNEVLSRSQATTLVGAGNMFTLSADLQRGIFTKKADEVDPIQAAAIKAIVGT